MAMGCHGGTPKWRVYKAYKGKLDENGRQWKTVLQVAEKCSAENDETQWHMGMMACAIASCAKT